MSAHRFPIRSRRTRLLASVVAAAAALGSAASLASATAAAPPRCATAQLVAWIDTQGNGAAGSTYYKLHLTNLSGRPCTLRGYPGVSAIGLTGRQLGRPASRNPAHPAGLVALRAGATATAILQITDVHNFPAAACHATTAAGLRVYPPNQTTARQVPYPFPACRGNGIAYLHLEALQ
jgi:hypothetical protein